MSVTNAHYRKLALAFPEATEEDHWGKPSFRVRGKIFGTLWVKERAAVLKLSLDEQDTFCAAQPQVFTRTPWAHQGWTRIDLKKVEAKLFAALLQEAWRRVAPKSLQRA